MEVLVIFVAVIASIIVVIAFTVAAERRALSAMSPEQREAYWQRKREAAAEQMRRRRELAQATALRQYGPVSEAIICPHCQVKGQVHTKTIKQKKGISGAKTTAALMTGGTSILVTGLSRKERNMQAHCDNCGSTWML